MVTFNYIAPPRLLLDGDANDSSEDYSDHESTLPMGPRLKMIEKELALLREQMVALKEKIRELEELKSSDFAFRDEIQRQRREFDEEIQRQRVEFEDEVKRLRGGGDYDYEGNRVRRGSELEFIRYCCRHCGSADHSFYNCTKKQCPICFTIGVNSDHIHRCIKAYHDKKNAGGRVGGRNRRNLNQHRLEPYNKKLSSRPNSKYVWTRSADLSTGGWVKI